LSPSREIKSSSVAGVFFRGSRELLQRLPGTSSEAPGDFYRVSQEFLLRLRLPGTSLEAPGDFSRGSRGLL
jgi:hypothetical protein